MSLRSGWVALVCAAVMGACDGDARKSGSGSGADDVTDASGEDTLLETSADLVPGETGEADGDDAAPSPQNEPGTHGETLVVDGMEREAIVYVPEAARGVRAPVVFMLHGTSGDGQIFYEHSGWVEKADEVGLIAVFPSALRHCFFEDENHDGDYDDPGERKVTTKWSSGKLGEADGMPPCTEADIAALSPAKQAEVDHPVADDVAFFDAMLAMLSERYLVDEDAIYVSGFSNGAQMTARLAVERAHVIAAAHAAAGTLTVAGTSTRPISVIFSVGSLDDRFTVPMGVAELPLEEEALTALPLFPQMLFKYFSALQLTDDYTYDLLPVGGKNVARFTFATSAVGATNTFQAVVIEDLYHKYPNGQNHVVDAPNLLWPFFEGHRLP